LKPGARQADATLEQSRPKQPADAPMGGTVSNGCSGIFLEEGEDDMESSSSSGRPKVPTVIANGNYQVTKKLGSGSYSDVYACFDTRSGERVAAKFEWINAEKTGKLLAEAEMCKIFAERLPMGPRKSCVPFVRWVGTQGEFNIMVMDVLGPSIEDLLEKCGGSFSLRTVLMLGEQMVTLLEYVHARGILHRDIKPNNFLIGLGENRNKIYIVDFGLSRRYIDSNGKHIPWVKKKGFTGTVRYITKNLHDGNEPSRRDDLGSVGYVLMYTLLGRLPWQGISAKSKKTKQRRIGARKLKVPHEKLCRGFPPELQRYLEYCDALQYDETPDYDFLRSLFRTALERLDEEDDDHCGTKTFDWLLAPDERPPPAPNAKRKRIRNNSIPAAEDICMIPAEVAEAKRRKVSTELKFDDPTPRGRIEALPTATMKDDGPTIQPLKPEVSSSESDKDEEESSESEYEYEYEEGSEEEREASEEESESEEEESEESENENEEEERRDGKRYQ